MTRFSTFCWLTQVHYEQLGEDFRLWESILGLWASALGFWESIFNLWVSWNSFGAFGSPFLVISCRFSALRVNFGSVNVVVEFMRVHFWALRVKFCFHMSIIIGWTQFWAFSSRYLALGVNYGSRCKALQLHPTTPEPILGLSENLL